MSRLFFMWNIYQEFYIYITANRYFLCSCSTRSTTYPYLMCVSVVQSTKFASFSGRKLQKKTCFPVFLAEEVNLTVVSSLFQMFNSYIKTLNYIFSSRVHFCDYFRDQFIFRTKLHFQCLLHRCIVGKYLISTRLFDALLQTTLSADCKPLVYPHQKKLSPQCFWVLPRPVFPRWCTPPQRSRSPLCTACPAWSRSISAAHREEPWGTLLDKR